MSNFSHGQSPSGILSLTGGMKTITRFGASTNDDTLLVPGPMVEAGLQVRLLPSWFLKVTAVRPAVLPLTFVGAGFRIAMPGFFLMGVESSAEHTKKRRLRFAETALHLDLYRVNDLTNPEAPLNYFSPQGSFVIDWMIVPRLGTFIQTSVGILALKGNLYASSGLGLGIEF